MESLLSLLKKTITFFESKGVAEARLNAEHLFAHVLNCSRLDLYLQFERPMGSAEVDALRACVVRRAALEPLQYIVGHVDFFGVKIKVDSRALIPRPETEELVEKVVRTLQVPPQRICELGTGTGCIAIALAKQYPQAHVIAIDRAESALALALENIQTHQLSARITLLRSDWFQALDPQLFDLIIANPPYLTQAEWQSARPELKQFEPKCALVGQGSDGIGDLKQILSAGIRFLAPNGLISMETGIAQHATLKGYADTLGFVKSESFKDLQQRERFFFSWK